MRTTKGIALVVTLLAALALLVVTLAVVGTFSTSNRRAAGSKSEELKAQYAAESGVEQSRAVLETFGQLLNKTRVDLSSGTPAVRALAARLAAFCYGPASPSSSTLKALEDAIRGKRSFRCASDRKKLEAEIADPAISDAQLGRHWLPIFLEYIERSVYESFGIAKPGDSASAYRDKVARYWGQVMRGTQTSLMRVIDTPAGQTVRYRIATDSNAGIVPSQLIVERGRIELRFGSLTGREQILSIGEVLDKGGKVLAKRVVQIGNEGQTRLALQILPPSYAWYAFFYDQQPSLSGSSLVVFTSQTVIDGPVHANDYLAFERGSRPWFGGPVSSAGPSARGGGIRAYWRETLSGRTGYETPPPGVDGEHWWNLTESNPEFAPATNALGEVICYDPIARREELCKRVDHDGDGQPDPPWEVKRDVNWDHAKIPLPGSRGINDLRAMALSGGIYVDGAEFCNPGRLTRKVRAGDPAPTQCVGRYLGDPGEGFGRIELEALGNTQRIRITLTKVTGWKHVRTEGAYWERITYCPPAPPSPGPKPPGGGGGGGGVHRNPPSPPALSRLPGPGALWAQRWDIDPTGKACSGIKKPGCPSGCTCPTYNCIVAKDVYKIETEQEYLVLEYKDSDPYLKVVAQRGAMSPVSYATGPFNGVIVVEPDDFFVSGPPKSDPADPPKPAIAEFAQITVASPLDLHITGDLTYAKPACTKTPRRDTSDEDGDGDTEEVIDRCTEEDYKNPADNLLGIYARSVWLNPQGVWAKEGADLSVHAVLMAFDGEIKTRRVQDCGRGELGRFKLLGGMIQKRIGALNWQKRCGGDVKLLGYRSALTYDRRMLEGLAPPGFPRFVEGEWDAKLSDVDAGAPGFWRHVPDN